MRFRPALSSTDLWKLGVGGWELAPSEALASGWLSECSSHAGRSPAARGEETAVSEAHTLEANAEGGLQELAVGFSRIRVHTRNGL